MLHEVPDSDRPHNRVLFLNMPAVQSCLNKAVNYGAKKNAEITHAFGSHSVLATTTRSGLRIPGRLTRQVAKTKNGWKYSSHLDNGTWRLRGHSRAKWEQRVDSES